MAIQGPWFRDFGAIKVVQTRMKALKLCNLATLKVTVLGIRFLCFFMPLYGFHTPKYATFKDSSHSD